MSLYRSWLISSSAVTYELHDSLKLMERNRTRCTLFRSACFCTKVRSFAQKCARCALCFSRSNWWCYGSFPILVVLFQKPHLFMNSARSKYLRSFERWKEQKGMLDGSSRYIEIPSSTLLGTQWRTEDLKKQMGFLKLPRGWGMTDRNRSALSAGSNTNRMVGSFPKSFSSEK